MERLTSDLRAALPATAARRERPGTMKPTADIGEAVSQLRDAIALHEKHMNGSAPTTGPAGERSQTAMMKMMRAALSALGGLA